MTWIPGAVQLMPFRRYELINAMAGLNATGVPLVGLHDGRPYAAGFSDDLGLFFFVPQIARITGLSLDGAALLFLGGILAVSLAIGACGWWLFARSMTARVLGVVAMALVSYWALRLGDVNAVTTALPFAIVPALLLLWRRGGPWWRWAVTLALTGLAAGLAGLVRGEARVAVPALALVLTLARRRETWTRRMLSCALLVMVTALPALGMRAVERNRDRYLARNVPGYIPPPHSHAIWHSVYIGFGFLTNDYGLLYKDNIAYARVAAVRPGTPIYSPAYAAVLRRECVRLFLHDPAFVGRTIMAKAGVIAFYLLVFGNIGLLAALRVRKPWPLDMAFAAGLAAAALPGLLVMPTTRYLEGFTALTVLYALVSIDWALSTRGARSPHAVAPLRPGAVASDAGLGSADTMAPALGHRSGRGDQP